MNIGYDIRSFLKEETGVGIYFKNLLTELAKLNEKDSFFLFSSSLKDRFDNSKLPPFRNRNVTDLRLPVSIMNFLWYKLKIPPFGFFFGKSMDILHSPTPLILPGNGKKIITVYDLCFIDQPSMVMKEALVYFKNHLAMSLKKCHRVIAISEFTKNMIKTHFGSSYADKTEVIYLGCDLDVVAESKPDFKIPEQFLLYVGTIEPRKNLPTLIRAFKEISKIKRELKLILAGKNGWQFQETIDLISELNLGEKILNINYLNRSELKYLYQRSIALVFPSLYEGFGLPVLEAAYSGIPVIASDLLVFKEIFSDYPLYFKKDSPQSLEKKIIQLLDDDSLYREKIAKSAVIRKQYTWQKTAQKTMRLYKDLYNENSD